MDYHHSGKATNDVDGTSKFNPENVIVDIALPEKIFKIPQLKTVKIVTS